MVWGDVATWVTGGITAVAVLLATQQLRAARRQEQRVRQVDVDGVAVTWHAEHAPSSPDADGTGTATWVITAHNPGVLPIRDVSVSLEFPVPVRRRHHSFHEDETTVWTDTCPAIEGSGRREWRRGLTVRFEDRRRLREVRATVTFKDVNGVEHVNEWGWGTQATATRTS